MRSIQLMVALVAGALAGAPLSTAAAESDTGIQIASGSLDASIKGVAFIRYNATEDADDPESTSPDDFDVAEVKLYFAGRLASNTSYKVLYSIRKNTLWDAFLTYAPDERFSVRVGQFKVPFSEAGLSFANPAPSQPLIRGPRIYETHAGSSADNPRISPRDIGLVLGSELLQGKCRLSLGVFNGSGVNIDDVNDAKDLVARAVLQPFKGMESPLSPLRLGGAYWGGDQLEEEGLGKKRERISGLLAYAAEKITLQSEYIAQSREGDGSDLLTWSWHALASYQISPHITALARYEQYDPNDEIADDQELLTSLGANCHLNDHVAIRANYNLYDEEGTEVDNNELLVQLDLRF